LEALIHNCADHHANLTEYDGTPKETFGWRFVVRGTKGQKDENQNSYCG
jgi:hypothetical protein